MSYYVTVFALEPRCFDKRVVVFLRRKAHRSGRVTRCALRVRCSAMMLGQVLGVARIARVHALLDETALGWIAC
jgi:hypothetical protein